MVHISVQVITMLVGCGLLAKTVTIGAGALALPAVTSAGAVDLSRIQVRQRAQAVTYTCCANAQRCGGGCGSGQVKFRCTSASCPGGGSCTGCQSSSPNCYNIQLPTCA